MGKEEILSKLKIKDYNNDLENILEKKAFSEDVKNLLLNMLYKIENSYEDYSIVKAETIPKNEFIAEVLNIVKDNCKKITIDNEASTVDIENGEIITKPNETQLLQLLFMLKKDAFNISEEYKNIKDPLETLLKNGNAMDKTEMIRDFDGWSWNILYSGIYNKTYNLVYQNLKMLLGYKFMQSWAENREEDTIEVLQKELEEKSNKRTSNLICRYINQISILEYMKINSKYKEKIISRRNDIKEELSELLDKKKYIQNIGETKKRIAKEINNIDSIINDNDLAREEFKRRNELLDEKEKIFSLSELIEILQSERERYVLALKKKNKLMEPMTYIQTKENLEEELNLYEEIDLDNGNEEKIKKIVIDLQKEFLKVFFELLKKSKTKKEIVELIYKLRYYITISIDNETTIEKERLLTKDINNLKKNVLTRACKNGIIEIISKNIEVNYKIISEILNTKIAKLEDLSILLKRKDKQVLINIYDDNILDNSLCYDGIEEQNVKCNKKIKLFI